MAGNSAKAYDVKPPSSQVLSLLRFALRTLDLLPTCVYVIRAMLHKDVEQRITIESIKNHPWCVCVLFSCCPSSYVFDRFRDTQLPSASEVRSEMLNRQAKVLDYYTHKRQQREAADQLKAAERERKLRRDREALDKHAARQRGLRSSLPSNKPSQSSFSNSRPTTPKSATTPKRPHTFGSKVAPSPGAFVRLLPVALLCATWASGLACDGLIV
jgi:hypothetical protein